MTQKGDLDWAPAAARTRIGSRRPDRTRPGGPPPGACPGRPPGIGPVGPPLLTVAPSGNPAGPRFRVVRAARLPGEKEEGGREGGREGDGRRAGGQRGGSKGGRDTGGVVIGSAQGGPEPAGAARGAARGQGREELKRATVLEQTSAYLEKARAAHVRARGGKGGKGGGGGVCEGGVNESMFAMAMRSVVDPASDSEPISEPDAPPPPLCLCHDTFRPDVVQLPGPDDRDLGLSHRENPAHPGE